MSQSEMAYKMDDLQTKSKMMHSLQNTLYTAIFCQDVFSKDDFEWAFTLLGFMTFNITKSKKH